MNNCFGGGKKGRQVAKKYNEKLAALIEEEYERNKRTYVEGMSKEELAVYNKEIKKLITKKYKDMDIVIDLNATGMGE